VDLAILMVLVAAWEVSLVVVMAMAMDFLVETSRTLAWAIPVYLTVISSNTQYDFFGNNNNHNSIKYQIII
jgi:hypothetical protein